MDTDDSKEKLDWSMELNMGIEETRMLYDAVSHYAEVWPGKNENKPIAEKVRLLSLQNRLFAVILDHNLTQHFPNLDQE